VKYREYGLVDPQHPLFCYVDGLDSTGCHEIQVPIPAMGLWGGESRRRVSLFTTEGCVFLDSDAHNTDDEAKRDFLDEMPGVAVQWLAADDPSVAPNVFCATHAVVLFVSPAHNVPVVLIQVAGPHGL
jgi:hypothetical protein